MKTILITTDFSASSLNAARYAAALTQKLGTSHIIIYYSYDNVPIEAGTATESPLSLTHEGSLLALEVVEREIKEILNEDTKISIELKTNSLPLILGVEQLVEQQKVDLVVTSTTGKSGLTKLIVGSNTIKLASSCPAPLLIVPKETQFDSIDKIVFACDLNKVSQNTPVDGMKYLLEKLETTLLVFNVTLEGKRLNPDTIPQQHKLHHLLDRLNPEYYYTHSNDIADEIEDFAKDHKAGLIITIPRSYGFFDALFRRSVSKKLINDLEIPLLLMREKNV